MISAFAMELPEHLLSFLYLFGSFDVVELPLECVVSVSFRTKMLAYTLAPLGGFVAVHRAARRFPMAAGGLLTRGVLMESAFVMVFLLYPGLSSIIFSALSCSRFDDLTSYLRADMSVDCSTYDHSVTEGCAYLLILAIPLGVPLLYWVVIHYHRHELRAIRRLERFAADGNHTVLDHTHARPPTAASVEAEAEHKRRRRRAVALVEAKRREWEAHQEGASLRWSGR